MQVKITSSQPNRNRLGPGPIKASISESSSTLKSEDFIWLAHITWLFSRLSNRSKCHRVNSSLTYTHGDYLGWVSYFGDTYMSLRFENSEVPNLLKYLTRYSSVFSMSSIDLTPAETTATGVRPSSVRSALTSNVVSAPRWTPPMPPVTKIGIPA